jgi:hypothetical protein
MLDLVFSLNKCWYTSLQNMLAQLLINNVGSSLCLKNVGIFLKNVATFCWLEIINRKFTWTFVCWKPIPPPDEVEACSPCTNTRPIQSACRSYKRDPVAGRVFFSRRRTEHHRAESPPTPPEQSRGEDMAEKKGAAARKEEVVTREYTINLHKRLHGWYVSTISLPCCFLLPAVLCHSQRDLDRPRCSWCATDAS